MGFNAGYQFSKEWHCNLVPQGIEVTTIVPRNHLSIDGGWAKDINYFREKSFDFFIEEGIPNGGCDQREVALGTSCGRIQENF
jgi:hypothetical protein